MKLLTATLVALALAAAGCGGGDEENGAPAGDQEAVEEVVKKWLLEGGCERMTDKFLEAQLLGLGDNRQERCDLFEKQHTKPQYGEDQIKITEVRVSGTRASLVVGSDNAPDITSKYELVKTGGRWLIDSAELE
jgi:ABC-type glycerol-3-phosphate transport system substrate-binding protein